MSDFGHAHRMRLLAESATATPEGDADAGRARKVAKFWAKTHLPLVFRMIEELASRAERLYVERCPTTMAAEELRDLLQHEGYKVELIYGAPDDDSVKDRLVIRW